MQCLRLGCSVLRRVAAFLKVPRVRSARPAALFCEICEICSWKKPCAVYIRRGDALASGLDVENLLGTGPGSFYIATVLLVHGPVRALAISTAVVNALAPLTVFKRPSRPADRASP